MATMGYYEDKTSPLYGKKWYNFYCGASDIREGVTRRMAAIAASPFQIDPRYPAGYGKKIPTCYKVFIANRWRRVYNCIYSNSGTLYAIVDGKDAVINIF